MFVVKADHPDVDFTITPPNALDSEGHQTDSPLRVGITSDNDDAVSITSTVDDELRGTVHFGNPGLANVNCTFWAGNTLVGSFGAQFTVTAGDPSTISGGSITFTGLSEEPEIADVIVVSEPPINVINPIMPDDIVPDDADETDVDSDFSSDDPADGQSEEFIQS